MTNQLFAQSNSPSCSYVPTADERANYQAIMTQKNTNSGPAPVLAPVPLNATIPIYFWVNKPYRESTPTLLELNRIVERVNTYFNFPNNARFAFCGVSYLNESFWYTMSGSTVNAQVFNTYNKANSINVYIPETVAASWLGGPDQSRIVLQIWGADNGSQSSLLADRVFAHELGHFFRLLHTHNEQNDVRERVIRAFDGTKPNPQPNFGIAADMMISTAADPYECKDVCSAASCTEVDDNQDPYAPTMPITNLMSYHCVNTSIFTAQQQDKNLDDQILANEFYDAKGKLVPLAMEWTNETNATVTNTMTVNAFPNPFTNEVSFDINSPVAGSATITITNIVTGQSHISQKQVTQGANIITINNVASLAAGALTYTVIVGTQVVNGTITKAR